MSALMYISTALQMETKITTKKFVEIGVKKREN
jgi:hypothetical protein